MPLVALAIDITHCDAMNLLGALRRALRCPPYAERDAECAEAPALPCIVTWHESAVEHLAARLASSPAEFLPLTRWPPRVLSHGRTGSRVNRRNLSTQAPPASKTMNTSASYTFRSDDHRAEFARWFVQERIRIFRRDTAICLTPDQRGDYAYMPTLAYCISLLELLSGLYGGRLKGIHAEGIVTYAQAFMDRNVYTDDLLRLVYELFRHKIAHITKPYCVLDTAAVGTDGTVGKRFPKHRITWTISEKTDLPPISLVSEVGLLSGPAYPWSLPYTHRCTIGLPALCHDIPESALGDNGYLARLEKETDLAANFCECMRLFYPPAQD